MRVAGAPNRGLAAPSGPGGPFTPADILAEKKGLGVLRPGSEAELSEAVAGAVGALQVRGGGTRMAAEGGEVLSTAGLSGISLYEPGALTIVAQAGTPLSEVQALLAEQGQRLAFEPMDHCGLMGTDGVATIGGVVAGNVCGPRRVAVGACRDFLLGVRFVDGVGNIIKNGGRVMKNVTGYDLVKLMAGSFGTLGVLSEVALKVLPRPEAWRVLLLDGLADVRAVAAMAAALGSPFEVTGAAHAVVAPGGAPVTMLRVEGLESSVVYRARRLVSLLADFGDVRVEDDAVVCAALWQWVRDVQAFHAAAGDVWRISVTPSAAPAIVARLGAQGVLYDWGGGLIWVLVHEGVDLRAELGLFQGHATLVRANAETRARVAMFQPEPSAIAAISAGLRARFDPRDILNPGLMG